MLYQIFALTIKDLKILFRDRGGMITLFAMPIMFILVMSVALQSAFQVGGAFSSNMVGDGSNFV